MRPRAAVQPVSPDYTGKTKGTQESGHERRGSCSTRQSRLYRQKLEAKGTQESGHEGEAAVQLTDYTGKLEAKGTQESGQEAKQLFNLRILFAPQLSAVSQGAETQTIDYPIEVITDDNKYVDEEVVEQEGKGSQKSENLQTIDGVKVE